MAGEIGADLAFVIGRVRTGYRQEASMEVARRAVHDQAAVQPGAGVECRVYIALTLDDYLEALAEFEPGNETLERQRQQWREAVLKTPDGWQVAGVVHWFERGPVVLQ